ncbi:hypothetical protein [Solidesulfovibrio alcoholivorans]|uniref:hypothetical protein n=1 Tax=Solidesulfovibrio alcoholivorans TaxID=81406 RepID=UPI0004963FE9|nr:hypothetical protein [Solidesulfovibrio alcoholivorans]
MPQQTDTAARHVPPLATPETLAALAASESGTGAPVPDRTDPFAQTRFVCVRHGGGRGVGIGRPHARP